MTPEVAEYLRALLLVGLDDRFEAYFDNVLNTEDPLSNVILSLCSCGSNQNQILSVLYEYTQTHPFDEQAVYDLILEDILDRYRTGKLTRIQTASVLYRIVMQLDRFWEEPWQKLTVPYYVLELYEIDMICEEVFNQCFDAWLYRGERLDPWKLQSQCNIRSNRRKNFWKVFLLLLPIVAVVLELLPDGVVMWFGRQTEDGTVIFLKETYSYFSLMPFGYGLFLPLITGILTIVLLILAIINLLSKKMRTKGVLWVSSIAVCLSCVHYLMGIRYVTVIGIAITTLLAVQCILAFYLSKRK